MVTMRLTGQVVKLGNAEAQFKCVQIEILQFLNLKIILNVHVFCGPILHKHKHLEDSLTT